jgi:hypothetical protein
MRIKLLAKQTVNAQRRAERVFLGLGPIKKPHNHTDDR